MVDRPPNRLAMVGDRLARGQARAMVPRVVNYLDGLVG